MEDVDSKKTESVVKRIQNYSEEGKRELNRERTSKKAKKKNYKNTANE